MNIMRLAEKKLDAMKDRLATGKFAIYPFGLEGKAVKSLLEVQYGISPMLLLDNGLAKRYPDRIYSVEILRETQYQDVTVLIASDSVEVFDDLRDRLYAVHPREKCIDLFMESYKEMVNPVVSVVEKAEVYDAMEKIKSLGMMKTGMIYAPTHTHAKFFLPFAHVDLIQRIILLSDNYFEADLLKETFEEFEGGRISRAVRGHSVLDIGANIGNHSLYFTLEAGARKVVSFEPVPMTFSILEENIALNHLEECVELHNCGLGREDSCADLLEYHAGNLGGTAIYPDKDGKLIVKTLDELKLPDDIALIKIDVEGMEYDVVQGALKTIKKQHPFMMIESLSQNAPKLLNLMEKLGYQHILRGAWDYLFY